LALAAWLLVGSSPATAQIPDEFTNLKVLPDDIGQRELISIMRNFAGALGVRCNHCHVGPDNLQGMNFATDELEPKRVARAMMKMTGEINDKLLPASGRSDLLRVKCTTCHRGVTRPEMLGDIVLAAIDAGGVDVALQRYGELREEYYGKGSYDFSANTLNGVAETLASERQDMEAAAALVRANIELDPDVAYSHLMLAQLLAQMGDVEGAGKHIDRALELEPNNDFAKRMKQRLGGSD
jgi:tetratricopeptide (TPR) repeat protein